MPYPIAKYTVLHLAKALWIKKVNGLSNIPKDEPFIYASNHGSFIDDLLIPCVIFGHVKKYVHFYCNDKFFKNFFTRKFLEWGRVIPIRVYESPNQKEINKKAFNLALDYLKKNEPVGIFPEGHRTTDGELQKARTGVATLAIKSNVPVVPIGIIGSYKIWPKGKRLPTLNKCIINIGKPMQFKTNDKEKITKDIMIKIAELADLKYNY
ncbi:MAG: lysophospholipid acyltransferase family protein [Nanoarchaeota archaeon]